MYLFYQPYSNILKSNEIAVGYISRQIRLLPSDFSNFQSSFQFQIQNFQTFQSYFQIIPFLLQVKFGTAYMPFLLGAKVQVENQENGFVQQFETSKTKDEIYSTPTPNL